MVHRNVITLNGNEMLAKAKTSKKRWKLSAKQDRDMRRFAEDFHMPFIDHFRLKMFVGEAARHRADCYTAGRYSPGPPQRGPFYYV